MDEKPIASKEVKEEVKEKKSFLAQEQLTILPSQFLPYPKDAIIKYSVFGYGEIKQFSQSSMNEASIVRFLLQGIDTSFDKTKLTLPDFLFIGVLRRAYALGSELGTIKFNCGIKLAGSKDKCDQKNGVSIKKECIEFDNLLSEIKTPELPLAVTIGETEYSFRAGTVGDFLYLLDQRKLKDGHTDSESLLFMTCASFEDLSKIEPKEFRDRYDIFFNVSRDDGDVLNEVEKLLNHGMKPVKIKCKKCGGTTSFAIDRRDLTFVKPFRNSSGTTRDRIRFGVKRNN